MAVESLKSSKDVSMDDEFVIEPKSHLTDDELWELIEKDERVCKRDCVLKNKEKFLIKLRKYLHSIENSEGFDCSDFPCRITGVTTIEPKQDIVDLINYRPEGHRYLQMLAQAALDLYNELHGTQFLYPRVKKANTLLARDRDDCIYYITFSAAYFGGELNKSAFEAKVCGKQLSDRKILFCRLKINASSEERN